MTRRCSEQRFFLRPDPMVRQIFEYVLALACETYGMQLHAFVAMSNHYHLVVTDPHGHISDFAQFLNALVARAVNCFRGRRESFWDPEPFNGVELLDEEAVFERLAYTHANPVRARLVSRAEQWSGSSSVGLGFGQCREIERPNVFFSERMPARATLRLVRPKMMHELDDIELESAVSERVREIEGASAVAGSAMGMRQVLRQRCNESPASRTTNLHLRPKLAASCSRIREAALAAYRQWYDSYADALRQFRDGVRDVVFPAGTYWMCVKLGCLIAPS
ncbi:transposase [Nannocystaceae bacterium ST9]